MAYTLVTGGGGFIGSFMVERLLSAGHQVRVIDALVPQVHGEGRTRSAYIPAEVDFIHADLRDSAAVARALQGVNKVVHLAAEVGVGQSMYEITRYVGGNTYATAVLLQEMLPIRERIERFVVASSMSIYGEGEYDCLNCGVIAPRLRGEQQLQQHRWEVVCAQCSAEARPIPTRETKPLYPTSIYAITKRDHEELCLVFGQAYGIPTSAMRFFNVYGPRQALSNPYTGVAAIFSSRLLARKRPPVFEDGRQSRDFVHVTDLVNGILLALDSDRAAGEVFNLGTGLPRTIGEVAQALAQALGREFEPELLGQYRAGDIRHCFADISKARQVLGYQPQVSFDGGIRELVEWVRKQHVDERVDKARHELERMGLTR
jgi:dTDP-L-rhamnose 4-epimerase